MIREGLLDSERYWSVTIEAQRMFFHMLLLADDFGCISVSPTFLRRRCFSDSPTAERIAKLLNELIDVDLIRTYEVDRTCLAFIPRFRQRLYRNTLKHPAPPECVYQDDADAAEKFKAIKQERQKTPVVPPESPGLPPPEVEEKRREENKPNAFFEAFWKAYPKKKSKGDAERAFRKLAVDDAFMVDLLAALDVAKRSDGWVKDGGQFIPYPASWLNAKGWEDEIAAPASGKTAPRPKALIEAEIPVQATQEGRVSGLANLKAVLK